MAGKKRGLLLHKQAWSLIWQKNSLRIVFLDIVFFALFYFIGVNFGIFLTDALLLNFLMFLLYGFGMLLIYSFLKAKVLWLLAGKKRNLGNFYVLNLLLAFIVLSFYYVLNFLSLTFVKQQFRGMIGLIIVIIFGIFFYFYLNGSQSIFYTRGNGLKSLFLGLRLIDKAWLQLLLLMLVDILLLLAYILVVYGIGTALAFLIFKNNPAAYITYKAAFTWVTAIYLYLIHFYNRIYILKVAGNALHP